MTKKMPVVILAGGLGSRLEEETIITPKPMVMIGQYPILIHIMNIFSHFGFDNFIVCLGYKGYIIKEYFANYFLHNSNIAFDFSKGKNKVIIHSKKVKPWKVSLIDTGLSTQTGGRLKMVRKFITEKNFFFTYGDGVADINIKKLLSFHLQQKKLATITAINPPGRFGVLEVDSKSKVRSFSEKPIGSSGWISGGFFVLNRKVFNYIKNENTPWEGKPLQTLTAENNLVAYQHKGFWKCMDTLRDKKELEKLWHENKAPWKVWK